MSVATTTAPKTFTIKDPTAPATEAQVKFFTTLVIQATPKIPGVSPEDIATSVTAKAQAMTKGQISAAINELKAQTAAMPKVAKTATAPSTLIPGYYTIGEEIFVVVTSKAGHPYAKQWELPEGAAKTKWVYAPGAAAKISAAGVAPLTKEQAKEWGHLHGKCIVCGATLSDPTSVEAGIGPICAAKF